MIRLSCPNCSQALSARPELAGKSATCSRCKTVIAIPHPTSTAPTAEAELSAIKVECTNCQASLRVPGNLQGKIIACPKCGTRVTAPAPTSEGTPHRPERSMRVAESLPETSFSAAQSKKPAKNRDSHEPFDVVDCPHCDEPNEVEEDAVGETIRCRGCKKRFRVPDGREDRDDDSDLEDSAEDDSDLEDSDLERFERRRRRKRRPRESNAGQICSILSIVSGAIAFLFCPPLFGITGLVLGIIGTNISSRKTLGIIGIVVSVVGTIAGIALGVFVALRMQHL
jgi:hypothetical protein